MLGGCDGDWFARGGVELRKLDLDTKAAGREGACAVRPWGAM